MKTRLTVVFLGLGLAIAAAPAAAQASLPAAPDAPPSPVPAPPRTPTPAPEVATAPEATPPVAEAPDAVVADGAPAPWYDSVSVNGFASVAYAYNPARPGDAANHLRVFDGDDNTINVDVIEVVVQKPASAPGEAGFRVDLEAGSTIPAASAAAGLFRDAGGVAGDFDLQQAVVSYVGDVGRGLRFDVGKFVTHLGYEVIEGYDGYDDEYSRSFLFGYAIPFTHTGVKLGYPLGDHLSGMVMVANGWDVVKDNNGGKTVGAQLGATLGDSTAYLSYVGGPEQPGNDHSWRHVVDLVATVKPGAGVTLGANADLGYEADATPAGAATWSGAALYARWDATAAFALAARGEVFDDADGARTGTAQTLVEGTLSPSVKLGDNLVLRGDLRVDRSDRQVFASHDLTSGHQVTVALNAIGVL